MGMILWGFGILGGWREGILSEVRFLISLAVERVRLLN